MWPWRALKVLRRNVATLEMTVDHLRQTITVHDEAFARKDAQITGLVDQVQVNEHALAVTRVRLEERERELERLSHDHEILKAEHSSIIHTLSGGGRPLFPKLTDDDPFAERDELPTEYVTPEDSTEMNLSALEDALAESKGE